MEKCRVIPSLNVKKLLAKLSILIISVTFALLAAEGVLRISGMWVGRHSDTMFTLMEFDPVLGWKMKPNVEEKVSFVDVENIPVHANSLGFWDREFKLEKDPLKTRIAFLGDSFTWGLGVTETERFSDVLASENSNFESQNFAIPGFGTDQSLLTWRNVASKYHPDVVVLTVYSNDYADNMFVVRSGLRKPYFEWHENSQLQLHDMAGNSSNFWTNGIFNEPAPPYASLFGPPEKRSRVLHWLVKHSDLARLGYTFLRHSKDSESSVEPTASAETKTTRVPAKSLSELGPTQKAQVQLLDVLVKQLSAEVTSNGAKFVVILAGEPNRNFDVQRSGRESERIKSLDAPTDTLASKLPGDKDLYFPYNKHWTAAGHKAVADMLNSYLAVKTTK